MLVVAFGAWAAKSKAPDPPVAEPVGAPTPESVQASLDQAKAVTNLDEAVKNHLVDLLQKALDHVRSADENRKKAQQYDSDSTDGPKLLDDLRKELEKPGEEPKCAVPEGATLPQLDQLLAQAESDLAQSRAEQAALETESAGRGDRRKQLPDLVETARKSLDSCKDEAAAPPDQPWFIPQVENARNVLVAACKADFEAQADALDKELNSYDIRGQLLDLRLQKAALDVAAKEKLARDWRIIVGNRRKLDAAEAAMQAHNAVLDAAEATPELRQFAENLAKDNQALVDRRKGPDGLVAKLEEVAAAQQEVDRQKAKVKEDESAAQQRFKLAGHSSGGLMLRRYKDQLPNARKLRRDIKDRQESISETEANLMECGEARRAIAKDEQKLKEARAQIPATLPAAQRAKLETLLQTLLESKRDALDDLNNDYNAYFQALVDLVARLRSLLDDTEKFAAFINENILWVRSDPPFGWGQLRIAPAAILSLLNPSQWARVPLALWSQWRTKYALDAAVLVGLGLLLWLYRRIAGQLALSTEEACKPVNLSLRPTIDATLATVLMAVPLPALLWLFGWRLSAEEGADFARSVGAALKDTAFALLALELVRQSLRSPGLFEGHFGWPSQPVRGMRRHFSWLMAIVAGVLFLTTLQDGVDIETGRGSLGRLLFLAGLLAAVAFFDRLMRPSSGAIPLLAGAAKRPEKRWLFRIGYAVVMLGPAALIVVAGAGYYYTAIQLARRLFETLCLAMALVFVRAFVLRWLLLARRRLAIEQAKRRKDAREKDPENPELAGQKEFDIAKIDQQNYRLLQSVIVTLFLAGAWFIWSEELPALAVLKTVEIYHGVKATLPNGVEVPGVIVTLANIVEALVAGAFTLIATANVPGLVELAVLQRLKLGKGERYAITTIVRYCVAIAGTVITFSLLGTPWEKFQWLVAALGVGLGFGLQEIFANFISGLIILFEQPIRVGDTVTVGGVTGTVTKIRIRATSIADFDCKELIVPNKEFVTSKVLNWTLNDPLLRLIIPVGVASGADPNLAQSLMYQVAEKHPHVLPYPAPRVLFTGFGDGVMSYELRVYCQGIDNLLSLRHALNIQIEELFRANKIQYRAPKEVPDSFPGRL